MKKPLFSNFYYLNLGLILLFVALQVSCKSSKQPGLFYKPTFNQLDGEKVKAKSNERESLDTFVVLLPNIRPEAVVVSTTFTFDDSLTVSTGDLIVPLEEINEKPRKYDTIYTVKDIVYRLDLIDRAFPKRIYANIVNLSDTLPIHYTKPIPFLTVAQIKADRQRVINKPDSIFGALDNRLPVKRGQSYNRQEFRSKYSPDSLLQLLCDTVYIRIKDSTTMVKQRPFHELVKVRNSRIHFRDEVTISDTIIFMRYYKDTLEFMLDMIVVEAGELKMGSADYDLDEREPYRTQISAFMIGKYEITNEEFCFFLNEVKASREGYALDKNGFEVKAIHFDDHPIKEMRQTKIAYHDTAKIYKFKPIPGFEKVPVVNVTWDGASMFAKKVNASLPSEAQWEFAARGGNRARRIYTDLDKKDYTYTNRYAGADAMAYVGVFADNSYGKPAPVGTRMANELGIHDMCGNVWEWCYDFYSADAYYRSARQSDPLNLYGNSQNSRVNRGGSWSSDAIFCRVTNRNYFTQEMYNPYLGFRIVAPLNNQTQNMANSNSR